MHSDARGAADGRRRAGCASGQSLVAHCGDRASGRSLINLATVSICRARRLGVSPRKNTEEVYTYIRSSLASGAGRVSCSGQLGAAGVHAGVPASKGASVSTVVASSSVPSVCVRLSDVRSAWTYVSPKSDADVLGLDICAGGRGATWNGITVGQRGWVVGRRCSLQGESEGCGWRASGLRRWRRRGRAWVR